MRRIEFLPSDYCGCVVAVAAAESYHEKETPFVDNVIN